MAACTKCGASMNPVERMLGAICGACVRDAHARATGGGPRTEAKRATEPVARARSPKITRTKDTWGEAWWYGWPPAGMANLAAEVQDPKSFGGENWAVKVWAEHNRTSEPTDHNRFPTKRAAVHAVKQMLRAANAKRL